MFRKLFIIILSLVVLFVAYRFVRGMGWLKHDIFSQIDNAIDKQIPELNTQDFQFSKEDLQAFGQDGLREIQTLAEKAKAAGGVAQEFVQDAVKVKEQDDKNISEKAFEYGRYIYCQEVVKQYEADKDQSSLQF
jgi:predicted membrane metal-binding protein